MNFNSLSPREKIMSLLAFAAVFFLAFWYLLLNPVISSFQNTSAAIEDVKNQIKAATMLTHTLTQEAPSGAGAMVSEVKLLNREAQLSKVMKYLDWQFRWLGVKLDNLQQSDQGNILVFDYRYNCTYPQFVYLINSLNKIDTVLVVDKATISQVGGRLNVEMRLLSAYL